MIKISMSLLLYATTCLVHPAQEQHTHALLLVEKIFSTRNLQLAPLSTLFLEDFFYLLATTTPYQQMRACTEATHTLEKEIEIQKTVKSQDEREHTLHILTVQKKHLERCAAILFQTLPWYARLQGWFVNCLDTLCCRVSSLCGRQKLPRISELKDGIIAYTHFEQTEIFSSHIRTLSFLSQNNIHSLPILIRFWDYPRHRHRLLNNVKLIEKGATPQAAGLATIAEETAEDIAAELEAAANAIKQVGQEAAENMSTTALEDTFDDGTSVEGSAEDFFEANTSDKLFYDGADTEGATTQETADSEAALLEEGTGAQVAQYGKILTKTDDAFTAALQADKDLPAVVESQAGQKELLAQMEEDFESTVTEIQDAQRGKWSLAFKNAMQKIEATGHKVSPLEIAFRRIDVAEGRLNGYLESLSKLYKKLPLRSTANQTAKVTSKVQSAAEKQLAAKFEELFGNTPWKKPFTQEQLQAFPGLKKEWELAVKTASKSNWSAEKISQYLQDTIPTKNEVIEAFKSPGTLFLNGVKGIGKAAVWFVVKGATLASKLTIRNIYRYLTKTTWGKMLLSIVEQSEVSMGSQMVISWQNAQEAQEFLVLSRERNALTTALNQFFVSLANQQQLSLNKIDAAFSANAATISQQLCITQTSKGSYVLQGLLPTLLNSQQSALNSALINCTTKQIFLSNQLQDDQLFYLSPMIIPEQESVTGFKSPFNTTWYNPHRSGNWQFCAVDYSMTTSAPVTSFVQYLAQPFTTTQSPHGDPTFAMQNSIFTDYIPAARFTDNDTEEHTIAIECTLLSAPFTPFMMGVICNGARWISGVLDFHHQHRLFCVYAVPGQPAGTCNVGFAETFYLTNDLFNSSQDQLADSGVPGGTNAVWPAFQLLSPGTGTTLESLYSQTITTPVSNPIATIPCLEIGVPYLFTIKTQPAQVTVTITKKDGTVVYPAASAQQQTPSFGQVGSNTIAGLDRLIALYHNIGFISAGCSAQFIVREPTDLVYTPQAIEQIQNVLRSGTAS